MTDFSQFPITLRDVYDAVTRIDEKLGTISTGNAVRDLRLDRTEKEVSDLRTERNAERREIQAQRTTLRAALIGAGVAILIAVAMIIVEVAV